jgi:predicted O-methyltransferase YrrM
VNSQGNRSVAVKTSFTTKILRRLNAYATRLARSCEVALRKRQLADARLGSAVAIHTHMTRPELNMLYDLAASLPTPARVLEIGSYLGASSCRLAAGLAQNGGHLYCVDTWANETMPEGSRDTFTQFLENTAGASSHITILRKRSNEMTSSDFRLPLQLAFIDADHSYVAAKGDVERVREWIEVGGVVIFHDTTFFEGVSRVLGELLVSGEWQLLGNVDSLTWLRKLGTTGMFPNPMSIAEREATR